LSVDLQKTVLETAKSLGQPTLSELVNSLVKQNGLKFGEATKAVYVEWKKGTIDLSEANSPSTLTSYFLNLENTWFWAITALIAVTMLVVFTVNGSLLIYARYALGGVFVLLLPGFMLISAL
jgi:hypothetical protein